MKISPGYGRVELPIKLVDNGLLEGAEIGVDCGQNALEFLRAGVIKLWLVDLWAQQADYFDIANVHNNQHWINMRSALTRIAEFPFRTTVLNGLSVEMADRIPDGSLDFVYIDANHSREAVTEDLNAWAKKVRPGGWVTGHDFLDNADYCGTGFGVKTAVLEYCEANAVDELFVCQTEPFPNFCFIKK